MHVRMDVRMTDGSTDGCIYAMVCYSMLWYAMVCYTMVYCGMVRYDKCRVGYRVSYGTVPSHTLGVR